MIMSTAHPPALTLPPERRLIEQHQPSAPSTGLAARTVAQSPLPRKGPCFLHATSFQIWTICPLQLPTIRWLNAIGGPMLRLGHLLSCPHGRKPKMGIRAEGSQFLKTLLLGLFSTGLTVALLAGTTGQFDAAPARTAPPEPTSSGPLGDGGLGEPTAVSEPDALLTSWEDAVARNESFPVSTLPNPAAQPFLLAAATEADHALALKCLTAAIYYEAASESIDGQRAVAQVVLNRVRHPAFPPTICGVVFEGAHRTTGCQFTFTCDGALARRPHPALWTRAYRIAERALAGAVHAPVGNATHYHTYWVFPYWGPHLVKVANIGAHIFYRWPGGWGRPHAFRRTYAGAEPLLPFMAPLEHLPPTAETLLAEMEERTILVTGPGLSETSAVPAGPAPPPRPKLPSNPELLTPASVTAVPARPSQQAELRSDRVLTVSAPTATQPAQ
jgi:hypothetical protein